MPGYITPGIDPGGEKIFYIKQDFPVDKSHMLQYNKQCAVKNRRTKILGKD